jgi:hypothetical protein
LLLSPWLFHPPGGAYRIAFTDEGVAESVLHVGTGVRKPFPTKVLVTKEWEIDNNINDMETKISLDGHSKALHEMFGHDEGPHLYKISKTQNSFKDLASQVASRVKGLQDSLEAAKVSENRDMLQTASKNTLQKMKQAQQNRKGAKKSKTISLS